MKSTARLLILGACMISLGCGAIGTGILFSGYLLSAARNPEESESLFSTALMAFALIETFIFLSFGLVILGFFL